MVSVIPNEEFNHLRHVEHMRAHDDQTPDTADGRTMTGEEAVSQECRKMEILLTQLRAAPHTDHRQTERLATEVRTLRAEVVHATEQNAQFVLAENMRHLSGRIAHLLA